LITGFNTDIEYNGVIYHVQTEDKGLETPLILSLIYTGGHILASKRSTYEDLLASGFDEKVLTERLHRQHKILCAAIKTGRIDDLIRLSQREANKKGSPQFGVGPRNVSTGARPGNLNPPIIEFPAITFNEGKTEKPIQGAPELKNVQIPTAERPTFGPTAFLLLEPPSTETISLRLGNETQFVAGRFIELAVAVQERNSPDSQLLCAIKVTAKIMGTSFRPLLFEAQTNSTGWAQFQFQLPVFNAGRAAVLFRAEAKGQVAELRRIVLAQPANK
jgi:hypothetical protein